MDVHLAMAATLIGGAIATLVAWARYLPWQNVLSAAALVFVLVLFALSLGLPPQSGTALRPEVLVPRLIYQGASGSAWIISILSARLIARLLLRSWKSLPFFGWLVISLSTVLATLLLMLCYNVMLPTRQGPSRIPFLGGASFVLLIAVTPFLLDKKPGQIAPDAAQRPDFRAAERIE
jgi:hypothetical protein